MKLLRKLPKRTLAIVLSIVLVVVSLPLIGRQLRAEAVNQPLDNVMIRQLAHALSEPDPNNPGQRRILPELEAMTWQFDGTNNFEAWGTRGWVGEAGVNGLVPVVDTTMYVNNAPNAMWNVIEIYRNIMHHSFDRTIPVVEYTTLPNIGAYIMPPSLNAAIRDRIFSMYPNFADSNVLFELFGESGGGEGNAGTHYVGGAISGGDRLHNASMFVGRDGTPFIDQTEDAFGGALVGGTAVGNFASRSIDRGWFGGSTSHSQRHAIYGQARLVGRVTRTNLEMYRSFATIESMPDTGHLRREMTTHMINISTRHHTPFNRFTQHIWLPNGHIHYGLRIGSGDNQIDVAHIRWGTHHPAAMEQGQNHAFMVYDLDPVDTGTSRQALLDYRTAISRSSQAGVWVDYEYLRTLNRSQLQQRQAQLVSSLGMLPGLFAQEGGILAPVMDHFGLPMLDFGQEVLDIINDLLSVFLTASIDYAAWFFSPLSAPAPGVIFNNQTPAAHNVFDSDAATQMSNPGYDPRADFTNLGFTLAELQDLYREAAFRRDRLLAMYNETPRTDFDNLVFATAFLIANPFTLDLSRAEAWTTRLNSIIQRWEIWDMRDAMVNLIELSANYSEGRNPNLGEYPFEDPFDDSHYTYCFDTILAWRDTAIGQRGFMSTKAAMSFADYVEAIVGFDDQTDTVAWHHNNRLVELVAEIGYRETHYFSEARWYSFRDFFLPLLAQSPFTHRSPQWIMNTLHNTAPHSNAPRPSFQGVLQNLEAYLAMSDAAAAYFAARDGITDAEARYRGGSWYSIFGGFEEVIHDLIDQMEHALAVNLALYTRAAMDILEELREGGDSSLIEHPSLSVYRPGYGNYYLFSWATLDELMRLVNGLGILEDTPANYLRDPWLFLRSVRNDVSQITLPGYPNLQAISDYLFLREHIWTLHNTFMNNPVYFHREASLPAPQRLANPSRDIRDNHYYNFPDPDPGKEGLEHLISGLDALLTGNLAPFVQAATALGLDLPDDLLGINLDANPLNVGSIVQDVVSEVLFSNATVNMAIELLYGLLLDEFEYIWETELLLLAGRGRIALDPIDTGVLGVVATIVGLNLRMASLWEVLNAHVYVGAVGGPLQMNGLASLRLYPDLLSRAIDPVVFAQPHEMLRRYSNLGTGMGSQGGASSRFFFTNTDVRGIYPTHAWSPVGSPHMFDADGNMLLDWGIDDLTGAAREERFRLALSQALSGALPLLQVLLFDRTHDLHYNGPAMFVRGGRAHTNVMGINVPVFGHGVLALNFRGLTSNGLDLYRNLLVPIFELLLGEEDMAAAGIHTNLSYVWGNFAATPVGMPPGQLSLSRADLTLATRQILNGILDPVNTLLDLIGNAPLATLIDLLPNLAFAFSAQRIEPMLNDLELVIDAYLNETRSHMGVTMNILVTTVDINLTGMIADMLGDMLPTERLNLSDMFLGAIDMGMLRSTEALFEALGLADINLPALSQFASMGTMLTSNHANPALQIPTLRAPGDHRWYIRANRADVLNVLLQWLFGSGLIAELLAEDDPMLVHLLQGTAEEMVAAVAQFAAPIQYDAPEVVLGTPVAVAYDPFPSWWARDGATGAEQDARFLVDHADLVLGHVWTILTGRPSLSVSINELLTNLLEPSSLFVFMADTVIDVLEDLLDGGIEAFDVLVPLIAQLVLIDGEGLDLEAMANAVINFPVAATAATIDDMEDVVQAMANLMAPLMPVLDVLLFGSRFDLLDVGTAADPRGLIAAYGGNGFADALVYIYNLFGLPLGLPAVVAPPVTASNEAKMSAIVMPIVDIANAVLDAPVSSMLTLLPNLIFFMAESEVGYSPLQQVLDALLHPVYVLLDTLRPLVNVAGVVGLGALDIADGVYFTNAGRLMVDPLTLIDNMLSELLEELLGEPLNMSLMNLMLGELSACGNYFVADQAAVLFALLSQAGALDWLEESGFAGLTALIQNERFEDLGLIDYTAAPAAAAAATPPSWLTTDHTQFLADNVDAVLNWLWREFLYNQSGVLQFIEDILQDLADETFGPGSIVFDLSVEETLQATVHGVFGYIQPVFDLMADVMLLLREILLDIEIPSLENLLGDDSAAPVDTTIFEIIAQILFVHDTHHDEIIPLCLDTLLFAPFFAYQANPADFEVTDEASAIAVLGDLFGGFMPLLNIFLAENNALLLYMGDDGTDLYINATNPNLDPDGALWRVFGYDGYRTALLPMLMALGGTVPGFVSTLMPYDDFRDATHSEQLQALVAPFAFLMNAMLQNPVDTLLRVLPNLAFFISDEGDGDSLLLQAVERLLWPVLVLLQEADVPEINEVLEALSEIFTIGTFLNAIIEGLGFALEDLIVGDITRFALMDYDGDVGVLAQLVYLDALGLPHAMFVDVDVAQLLVNILVALDVLDDLEDFAGLLNLLNMPGRERPSGSGLIDYRSAPSAVAAAPSPIGPEYVEFVLENLDGLIDWAWSLLVYGSDLRNIIEEIVDDLDLPIDLNFSIMPTIAETIEELFGTTLYTQENFDLIADFITNDVRALLGDIEIVDGLSFSISELIYALLTVGGQRIDLEAEFDRIAAMNPVISDQESFLDAIFELAGPIIMPLLRILLAEDDILVIVDDEVNDGLGLLIVDGFDGYRTALLPLLMMLGAGVPGFMDDAGLLTYAEFNAASDAEQLAAILDPILWLLNTLIESPVNTLLQMLPNLAYFVGGDDESSLLQQAINNLLHPLFVVLDWVNLPAVLDLLDADLDFEFDSLRNLGITSMVNDVLGGVFEDVFDVAGVTIDDFVVGTVTRFDAPFHLYGYAYDTAAGGAWFVEPDIAALVLQVVHLTGVLDDIDDDIINVILSLLNRPGRPRPANPQRLNYQAAPPAMLFDYSPYPWLTADHLNFLLDNADGVLNWLWGNVVRDNPELQDFVDDLLPDGLNVTLEDTIAETVHGVLGEFLYTSENFEMIIDLVLELVGPILGLEVLGLNLMEVLYDNVRITTATGDVGLDLELMFNRFESGLPAAVNTQEDFRDTMIWMLEPLVPLLRILLAEGDLAMIIHDDVVDGEGFLRIFGSNGYESALLPMLLAFGANVPGFVETLLSPEEFLAASDADMLGALIDPIFFLLEALIESPIFTLLQVLPNVVFFTGNGNDSLLQQAISNLLHPLQPILAIPMVDDLLGELNLNTIVGWLELEQIIEELDLGITLGHLIAGEVVLFGESHFNFNRPWLAQLGINDGAAFVEVNMADLIAGLLQALGVLDMAGDFGGLLNLLNMPGRERPEVHPFSWPYPNRRRTNDLYHMLFWTRNSGMLVAEQLPLLVDNVWSLLFGELSISELIEEILGDTLFTQENFDMIVELVQELLEALPLDEIDALIPGRTLRELLDGLVMVGEENVDLLGVLDDLANFPGAIVTDQESFMDGMIEFLLPVTPVLGWLLFGEDIVLLGGHDDINNGQGLLSVFGHEGYRLGLIPLLESLLMPLGGGDQIVAPALLSAEDAEGRLRGLLQPLLYLLQLVVEDPINTVIRLLPNVGYLLDSGLLQMSLDMLLHGINGIFTYVSDEPLITLDVVEMVDDILGGLGLHTLSHRTLANLQTGTIITFQSHSGAIGHYMFLYCEEDEADLFSALLRELINLVQYNAENRNVVVTAITDLIAPGNLIIRWGLQFVLWMGRVIGTSLSMTVMLGLVRVVNAIWTPIVGRFF